MNRTAHEGAPSPQGRSLLVGACGGTERPGRGRRRPADRDGLARRGADRASGTTSPRSSWRPTRRRRSRSTTRTTTCTRRSACPSLLAGRNAPDIYFEWTGARLAQRQKDGYVADITAAFKDGPLAGLFDDATLGAYTVDGKTIMVPYSADVTNVLWYNKQLLADAGVTPPTTWDELLAACDALNAKGVIPITTGNKDLWPAGNWFGHLASRVVGEQVYSDTLGRHRASSPRRSGRTPSATSRSSPTRSASTTPPTRSTTTRAPSCSSRARPPCIPIGSWLVSWAIDEAPDLDFDYVNLPADAGRRGQPGQRHRRRHRLRRSTPRARSRTRRSSSWRCSTATRTSRR